MNSGIALMAAAVAAMTAAPRAMGATAVEMLKGVKFSVVAYENGKPAPVKPPSGDQDIENTRQQVEKTLKELGLDFSLAEDCASASADVVRAIGMEGSGGVFRGGGVVMRKRDKKELLRKDWLGSMAGTTLTIDTPLPAEEMRKVRGMLTRRLLLADFYMNLKTGLSTGKWGRGDLSKSLPKCH